MGIETAIIGSAILGAGAASSAARTQAGAADRAAELQRQQFERQVELQAPFREAGVRALPELEAASRYTPFGMSQFQQDPGYAFRMSEGMKGLERSAAARGGLISGGALRAATRYGQDMGSQEYQNAYSRALTGYNANVARSDTGYNRLASLAGVGQTTGQQLGVAGANYAGAGSTTLGNYAQGASNALMAAGNAQAAGQMGIANTFAGGLGAAASSYQNQRNFTDYLNSRNQMGPPISAMNY